MGKEKDTRHGTTRHDVRVCVCFVPCWKRRGTGTRVEENVDGARLIKDSRVMARARAHHRSIHWSHTIRYDTIRYMDRSMFHIEQRIYRLYLNRGERARSILCRDCTLWVTLLSSAIWSRPCRQYPCTAHGYTYRPPLPSLSLSLSYLLYRRLSLCRFIWWIGAWYLNVDAGK